ncbi:unnamed protein product [Paramecium primaurelia]|uniref:Alpha-type protein kinase domain-containing protein n=1 Tax=Paramecium primaurelia TaxID=5886 RepID=A0A8S1NDL7_PARPR|nr:unnamed protein product [Paramecium primaurelia]
MEVKVSYGDQEISIMCPHDQLTGQYIFEQISNQFNLHQDSFELLIYTELGYKNLEKNQTLSQQNITQYNQNYLIFKKKSGIQYMQNTANFQQDNNFKISNQLAGVQASNYVNGQFTANQFNMIPSQMPANPQNQQLTNNIQGQPVQFQLPNLQSPPFVQNQQHGQTNTTNIPFQLQGQTNPMNSSYQYSGQPNPINNNQITGQPNPINNYQYAGQTIPMNNSNQFANPISNNQITGQQNPLINNQITGQPNPMNNFNQFANPINNNQPPGQPNLMNNTQFTVQPNSINNPNQQLAPPKINNAVFQFPVQQNSNPFQGQQNQMVNQFCPPQILNSISSQKQQDRQIEQLQDQLKQQEEQIEKLQDDKFKLENQIKRLNNEKNQLQTDYDEDIYKINLENKDKINKMQDAFNSTNFQNQSKIKLLQQEIEDLREQNQQLESDFNRQRYQMNRQSGPINERISIVQNDQTIIDELRAKNQSLTKQLRERDTIIQKKEYEIEQLQKQITDRDDKEKFQQSNKNDELDRRFKEQSQKFNILQSKVDELSHQAYVEQKKREDREKEITKLKEKVVNLETEKELLAIEINNDKKIIQCITEYTNKNQEGHNNQLMPQINQELQRLQENMQKELAQKKMQDQQKKKDEQQKILEDNAQRKIIMQEREQKIKYEKQQKACKLREAIMNTQGILQVGLLVDVTGSMDTYKDATMNIIQRTMGCIKSQTNRDCEWGAVCYQDFAELKQRGQYMQHQFTRDSNQMINFLKNITCDGGDDGAEDLRNGIKQMINNLKWEKYFKIALLICDAPCHGKKWTGNVLDDYPEEDLEDGLQQLINKNIVLIGIEFSQNTDVMFAQMKNFYAKQNKQQMLIVVDLKNKKPDQIQDQLINIISEASISITEVSQQGTKTKKENVKRDGALEALVKLLPDPTKFNQDPKITTIETTFKVFRVEINNNAFEKNITSIYKITVPQDYSITLESEWNCIRTLKPFAFGQLKEVYLMKKLNNAVQDEVYVIKMPIGGQTYKTMNEALLECRSHLISKRLMQKFMQDLNDKNFNALQIKYSDFLILQEHDSSFWIAERFFKGDFVKFNNNYGYINPKDDLLNNIAQLFSYYTYHISDFQYMICDVQGVGYNFTDPAINTSEGNFDETDLGQDGIGQYIISFEKDKAVRYQKFLDMLNLND